MTFPSHAFTLGCVLPFCFIIFRRIIFSPRRGSLLRWTFGPSQKILRRSFFIFPFLWHPPKRCCSPKLAKLFSHFHLVHCSFLRNLISTHLEFEKFSVTASHVSSRKFLLQPNLAKFSAASEFCTEPANGSAAPLSTLSHSDMKIFCRLQIWHMQPTCAVTTLRRFLGYHVARVPRWFRAGAGPRARVPRAGRHFDGGLAGSVLSPHTIPRPFRPTRRGYQGIAAG